MSERNQSHLNHPRTNHQHLSRPDLDASAFPNFDTMTPAQFEQYLPDLFAGGSPRVSTDPRLQSFLARNPDCAALVHDLEAIADHARSLFPVQEPSDSVWRKIAENIGDLTTGPQPLPEAD